MLRINLLVFIIASINFINFAQGFSTILPKDSSVQVENTVYFSWNKSDSAVYYELEIDSVSNLFLNAQLHNVHSLDTLVNLSENSYYWRARAIFFSSVGGWSYVKNFDIINLESLGSLSLWLKPELNNLTLESPNLVTSFQSNANLSYNLSQVTSANKPIYLDSVLNNKPALYFDGNDRLSSPNNLSLSSCFSVFQSFNTSYYAHSGLSSGTANPRFWLSVNTSGSINQPWYWSSSSWMVNGQQTQFVPLNNQFYMVSSNGSTRNMSNFNIAPSHSGYLAFKGNFFEQIVFSSPITNNDRDLIHRYLRFKYSPPVNLGPDIYVDYGFCPRTLKTNDNIVSCLWSNMSTGDSLVVNQTGLYWVEATDIFGYVSYDSIYISFPQYQTPGNTIFCQGDSLYWDPYLSNNYSYLWNSSSIASPNGLYVSSPGNYYFTVLDSNNCQLHSDTITFNVDNYPINASLGNDTSFCSGNSISLQVGSAETISYQWGNMQTSSSLTIDTSGAYDLYSTNINGCELFDTINVTIIGDAPNIQISFPDTVCELINFPISDFSTVASPAIIDSISWDLGNGNFSNQYSDTISYLDSGLYNVNLFLSTNQGCFIDSTFSILVNPSPDFTMEYQGICDYDSISFSIFNNGNNPLNNYDWTFDDSLSGFNNVDSINSPTHLFSTNGIYNVSLIVEDINGCLDTTIQQVEIFPSPIADFSITEACEGEEIQIDNNSVIDSSYSISGYLWTFGDNTQSVDSVPVKSFDSYGIYSIQLICTADSSLCTDTLVDSITINANPILNWDASVACKNTWASFSNLSTVPNDSIFQTLWVVNVLDSLNSNQIDYQFITTGNQQIQLQTSSSNFCVSDSVFMINVNDEVDLTYQTDPAVLATQVPFSCLLNDSLSLTSILWDFGDGFQSTLFSPIHTYNVDLIGDTLVVLTSGTNLMGCVDTIIQSVVLSAPIVDLELRQLLLSEDDGFYSIIVEMKNNGTISLSEVELLLNVPNSNPIKEITGLSLESGENVYYPLNVNPSSYNASQDSSLGFLCVEGVSYNDFGLEEVLLDNNWICQNTEKDSLNLIALYPNPIQNNINVLLHVPIESQIYFEIVDLNGKIVNKPVLPKIYASGTYKISIDATALSEGFYFFHVLDDRNNRIIRSFIK
ncbi:MAG: PKD domain-containing protein [Crocinitomicaceae bacterium]|nr:PKD domain-containing protein [Crocinitomicaceae bacterium]